jgi:beta-glucosidase
MTDFAYKDASKPVDERVNDLLSRMTVEEKLAQLGSAWVYELFSGKTFSEEKAKALLSNGIGHITRIAGASNASPQDSAKLANTIQRYLLDNTRLGIPAVVHEETCSGYMAMGATCFPQIIGLASTWEPDLVEAMTRIIREQMRAAGGHHSLAPVLDIVRDPRWGRVEETFGEDPYFTSRMGAAYVRGLQSDNLKTGVVATGKHFLGYGVTEGGMNWAPAHLGEREILEVFLPPFEAAIKESGMGSIMNAYHEIDGIPLASSREIFTELLREKLAFEGVVVSDYFAINMLYAYHKVARDKDDAARMALRAGIDIELPSTDCYGDPIRQALESGEIDIAAVDESVRRGLRIKFLLGLFESPFVDENTVAEVFDTPAQRAVAREIAQKSIVLLKNSGGILPLKKNIGSIAVIGPNAASGRNLMGDYSYPAHVETLVEMAESSTFDTPVPDEVSLVEESVPMINILAGIKNVVAAGTTINYAKGCEVLGDSTDGFADAIEAARKSDVAVVVVGGKSGLTDDCTCGEARDRAKLGLTGVQQQLVEAVHATGTPVVVVLINGRPLTLSWMEANVPAIVEAWLPGEEGGNAVADVLFGDVNPGGKLPMSFPREAGQIPVFYNHRPSGGRSHWKEHYVETNVKPLYPFGYGLSYTDFTVDNIRLDRAQAAPGNTVAISVDVANVGQRAGDEVVQLYVHDTFSDITRPLKELKGFARVSLNPGEKKTITFRLNVNQLGFYDRKMQYVVQPGQIDVMVGTSSRDIHCTSSFEITGETTDISKTRVFFAETVVS